MKDKITISPTNKRKNKIYILSVISVAILFVLIGFEIEKSGSYFDEIIGLVSIFFLIFFSRRISRTDLITIMILFIVVMIGIVSNIVSGLVTSARSIGVDIIVEIKLITSFFAMKYLTNEKEKNAIINALVPIAKLFILASFILGILSQFLNLGMSGEVRYGIRTFRFIFRFNHQYIATYILIFGILVCNSKMTDKQRNFYRVLAIIAILLAAKAPSLVFTSVYIGLSFYFQKNKVIKPWVYVVGIAVILFVGQFQINEYLLNDSAPRKLFIEYGAKTANHYFPIGSGFSTFGSGEAAKHYSPLYYTYGFEHRYGMSPEYPAFMNDTFWPMAIGQFGWIGGILYIYVFVRIFQTIDNTNYSYERRAFLYGAYIQYMVHAFGSAILSSSAGMIGFLSLAMFSVLTPEEKDRKGRLKIHF